MPCKDVDRRAGPNNAAQRYALFGDGNKELARPLGCQNRGDAVDPQTIGVGP